MKEILILDAEREGYSVKQINRTVTVGELIGILTGYDEDTPIYLSHDRGYTYGGIRESRFHIEKPEDEDQEDEDDTDPV